MNILELDLRCRDFRHRYCGKSIEDEVPLSFVAELFFALGTHPSLVTVRPTQARQMVAEDIGLAAQHEGEGE